MYSGSFGINTSLGWLYCPGSSGATSGKPNSLWAGCCWKLLVRQIRSLVSPGLMMEMVNSSRPNSMAVSSDTALERLLGGGLAGSGALGDRRRGFPVGHGRRLGGLCPLVLRAFGLGLPLGFRPKLCRAWIPARIWLFYGRRASEAEAASGVDLEAALEADVTGFDLALEAGGVPSLDLPDWSFEFLSSLFFMVEPPGSRTGYGRLRTGCPHTLTPVKVTESLRKSSVHKLFSRLPRCPYFIAKSKTFPLRPSGNPPPKVR